MFIANYKRYFLKYFNIIYFCIFLAACETPYVIPPVEVTTNTKHFSYSPALSFPKNLNQTASFSLKHQDDSLMKNFNIDFKYNIDPDYNFLEYNVEVNVRPDKLSVHPKKDGDLGKLGALYPMSLADTADFGWEWAHKGLIKRYDENLDFDIDFNLNDYLESNDRYFALRIAKNDSLYYGWFRMEITHDSIIFKEYAYSTGHAQLIIPQLVK